MYFMKNLVKTKQKITYVGTVRNLGATLLNTLSFTEGGTKEQRGKCTPQATQLLIIRTDEVSQLVGPRSSNVTAHSAIPRGPGEYGLKKLKNMEQSQDRSKGRGQESSQANSRATL